jgi:hypothetical protein
MMIGPPLILYDAYSRFGSGHRPFDGIDESKVIIASFRSLRQIVARVTTAESKFTASTPTRPGLRTKFGNGLLRGLSALDLLRAAGARRENFRPAIDDVGAPRTAELVRRGSRGSKSCSRPKSPACICLETRRAASFANSISVSMAATVPGPWRPFRQALVRKFRQHDEPPCAQYEVKDDETKFITSWEAAAQLEELFSEADAIKAGT